MESDHFKKAMQTYKYSTNIIIVDILINLIHKKT